MTAPSDTGHRRNEVRGLCSIYPKWTGQWSPRKWCNKRERVWRKRDHRVILSGQRRKLEKGGEQWSRKGWTCWSLRKGGMDGDVDFLREALRVLVEGIMDAEVSSRIGAEYGERSAERVTQRNGYRSRAWDTRRDDGSAHPKAQRRELLPEPAGATASQRASSAGGDPAGLRGRCILKAG